MMGAMDAQNMWSNLAINKYLRTVACRWISSTLLCDVIDSRTCYKRTSKENIDDKQNQLQMVTLSKAYPKCQHICVV